MCGGRPPTNSMMHDSTPGGGCIWDGTIATAAARAATTRGHIQAGPQQRADVFCFADAVALAPKGEIVTESSV